MIFALEEDRVFRAYASADEAVRAVEALDANETFLLVIDEQGQRYVVDWIRPNEVRQLGPLAMCENGEYCLNPVGRVEPGELRAALASAVAFDPPDIEVGLRCFLEPPDK